MKSGIYLDAYVLACPTADEGLSSMRNYIDNLISWAELKSDKWVKIYISQNTHETLAKVNSFPSFPIIKDTIAKLGITHIQPKDVNELVLSFLTKSSIVEDELDIEDLIFEDLMIEPIIPIDGRPQPFQDHFNHLATVLSLHHHFRPDINNQIFLTTREVSHTGLTEMSVRIPLLLTKSTKYVPENLSLPVIASSQYYLVKCKHTLHIYLDPINIWSNAKCQFALKKAIELSIYQNHSRRSPYQCTIDYNAFSFGSHFLSSCEDLGFLNECLKIKMLLRACAETILQIRTSDSHWIRTSAGPSAPQVKRGTDGAWRRDIDYEYHLHYWVTSEGPQFANVTHHNDLSIPND